MGAPSWTPDGANLHVHDRGGGGGAPIQHQTIASRDRQQDYLRRDRGRARWRRRESFIVSAGGRHAEADRRALGGTRRRRRTRRRGAGSTRRTRSRRARRTAARRGRPSRSTSAAVRRRCCTRRPSRQVLQRGQQHGERDFAGPQVAALHGRHDRVGSDLSSCRRRAARRRKSRRRRAITGARSGRTTAAISRGTPTPPTAPGDRHIEIATIGDDPAKATIIAVTSGSGTNTAPQVVA